MSEMAAGAAAAPDTQAEDVVLDVRGLEPPEPMVLTLEALERLPPGAALVQLNVRVPQFLLPLLDERGYDCAVEQEDADVVRVRISRRDTQG